MSPLSYLLYEEICDAVSFFPSTNYSLVFSIAAIRSALSLYDFCSRRKCVCYQLPLSDLEVEYAEGDFLT